MRSKRTSLFAALLATAFVATQVWMHILRINADELVPEFLWRDFMATGSLRGWELSPNSYLFPDILVYFTVRSLVGFWPLAYLLYGVLAVGLWASLAKRFAREVLSSAPEAWLWFCGAMAALFPVWYFDAPAFPVMHFSVVLVSLFAAIRVGKDHKFSAIFLLSVLFFLIGLSDLLSGPQFAAPWLLSRLYQNWRDRKWTLATSTSAGLPAAAVLVGGLLQTPLLHLGGISIAGQDALVCSSLGAFQDRGLQMLKEIPRFLFLNHFPLGFLIAAGFLSGVQALRSKTIGNRQKSAILFLLMSGSLPVVATFFSCRWGGPANVRYFLPLLFGVPLLGAAWVSLQNHFRKKLLGVALLGLGIALQVRFRDGYRWPANQERWSENIGCVLGFLHENNLRTGVADYWNTKLLMAFDEKLVLDQRKSDLTADNFLINFEWRKKMGETTFVVMGGLNKETVRIQFGEPKSIKECPETSIWEIHPLRP